MAFLMLLLAAFKYMIFKMYFNWLLATLDALQGERWGKNQIN